MVFRRVKIVPGDEIEIQIHGSIITGLVGGVDERDGDLCIGYTMLEVDGLRSDGGWATWRKSNGGKLVRVNGEPIIDA